MYFLSRTFKQPKNSKKPLISFGYFGDYHTESIVYFLTNIMRNYELVYSHDNDNSATPKGSNRCLKIEQNINLNNIINEYK